LGFNRIEGIAVPAAKSEVREDRLHKYPLQEFPMQYDASLKEIHAFLDTETPRMLSLPLAVLITGALSQIDATIELANRVYDSVFRPADQD
jgi:hypothetical protein